MNSSYVQSLSFGIHRELQLLENAKQAKNSEYYTEFRLRVS
jgi:hypothetical protein